MAKRSRKTASQPNTQSSVKPSANGTNATDRELLADLGIDITTEAAPARSPREERIIAGFEEIERFVTEQGRLPQHGEDRDIFERLYAVRLDRLRESAECRALLTPLDSHQLLDTDAHHRRCPDPATQPAPDLDDADLLAQLGLDPHQTDDITQLTHVRSRQEIKAAEEIAQRSPCADFVKFKSQFKQIQQDLKTGDRQTVKYQDNATINPGDWFIIDGHTALVAEVGEQFLSDYGLPNRRLRVVYDNGTESDLLLRSLQRALNKDKTSRRITTPDLGPLFSKSTPPSETPPQPPDSKDSPSGCIYILRSQSEDPFIAEHRSVIHKIGVTGGDVNKRITNAAKDPTYLLAPVEVVAQFQLTNINRQKLEALLHQFFDAVRLNVTLQDRFGIPVQPREWFLVPLPAIEAAIAKIQNGTLDQWHYDPETTQLKPQ